MTVLRFARIAVALGFASLAAACVATSVEMTPHYSANHQTAATTPEGGPAGSCRVRLIGVHDLRTDPHSLGGLGGQKVHIEDSTEWIRSGINAIADGAAIRLSAESDALSLDVDLLKAYLMTVTSETRSANVVLRVRYSVSGQALGEQIYRGTDNGLVWTGGEDETQTSLNVVLGKAVQAIRSDVLARCAAGIKFPAP
ncbi:MAG TPA: hypothetical protein VHE09_09810 [Rhizomicrobium sp.]|nr:hypothetical protein [Rhizomicrobium sp.]